MLAEGAIAPLMLLGVGGGRLYFLRAGLSIAEVCDRSLVMGGGAIAPLLD